MSVQPIHSFEHYHQIISGLSAGQVMVMSFVDPFAAPCWDFTIAFREASENPLYAEGGVRFFSVDCSQEELLPLMEQLVIPQVPMLVIIRVGHEAVKKTLSSNSRAHILAVIAQHCA